MIHFTTSVRGTAFGLLGMFSVLSATPACAAPPVIQEEKPEPPTIAEVFARVHTSVVTLHTVSSSPTVETFGLPVQQEGTGSGVLITKEGDILTAAHVVQTAEQVAVEFYDGTIVAAKVISSDPLTDLALVRLVELPPNRIAVTELGDSDKAPIGSRVFAVGSPLGISQTLTVGYLSARRSSPSLVNKSEKIEVLQTDAAINPGNSGGPLFNMQGEVIGVVSFISTLSGGSDGIGFAVSSNTCRERFLERPPLWSGLDYVSIGGRFAEILNVPRGKSAMLVQSVVKGGMADKLGLKGGDVPAEIGGLKLLLGGDLVLSVGGIDLGDADAGNSIRKLLVAMKPDDRIKVSVIRGGKRLLLTKPWGELQ